MNLPEPKLSSSVDKRISYRGVHHLALNTDDMQVTVDFYSGVLGMRLVHAMRIPAGAERAAELRGNPPFPCIRHYFFDMGNDSLLAFFEMPKGAKDKVDRNGIAGMQHVSFVMTHDDHMALLKQLEKYGVGYHGPMEPLEGIVSTYFYDPNGIRLEVSSQPADGADTHVLELVDQTYEEARSELLTLTDDRAWHDRVKTYMARQCVVT